MDSIVQYLRLPSQPGGQVLGLMLVFVALFAVAIAVERMRRRAERRARTEALWRAAEDHLREKELSEDQAGLLREVVRRHAGDQPLDAVTHRRAFNHCVALHIAGLRAARDEPKLHVHGRLLREVRIRLGLDFIPVGQRLESTRELAEGQFMMGKTRAGAGWFRMSVEEVDEAFVAVAPRAGQDDEAPPRLSPGAEVECRMWRQDDARYRFTLTLAKQTQEPPRLLFHHAERIERLQARQYFRVRCNQPVTAGIINVPPGEPIENLGARPDLRQLRGRLVSISAGGLAVEMMANLTARDIIRVPLRLQGCKPVTVAARVVGSEPRGGGNYLVRGEFVDISEDTRDVVAQYVWRRQKPVSQKDS